MSDEQKKPSVLGGDGDNSPSPSAPTSKQLSPGSSITSSPGRTPYPTTQTTPTDHKARVQLALITGARQHLDLSAAARALKDLPKRQLDAQVTETKAQTRRLLVENHQLMNPKSPTSLEKKE